MNLPPYFCWTRFGTEAGQLIEHILKRKEEERVANEGVFFWGIGNAIGPSIRELLRRVSTPEVLFSPIKSAPRPVDAAPAAVAVWTSAETLTGEVFTLPQRALVTSRHDPHGLRESRYALVCFSLDPLNVSRCDEKIALANFRNLITGRPIGSSQVTAVVQSAGNIKDKAFKYDIAMRVRLVPPYFLRLRDPLVLSKEDQASDWGKTVRLVWERRISGLSREAPPKARPLVF
jgi:hypothetical protein